MAPEELHKLRICLIAPKYESSFFSYHHSMELYPGPVRCHFMPGAPPALAGMLDRRHHIEIFDENVETIDFSRMSEFDVIGITGMIVQRARIMQILDLVRDCGAHIVIGGPLVTCDEQAFVGHCDTRFIGEAEQTWPVFIEDLAAGRPTQERYEQETRTDMSKVTKPRLDLMKTERYGMPSVQFSRGCPFRCEFCDIIVMFGRVPRVKQPEQVLAELDDVHAAGMRNCFLVDDNFIGNKREAKALLREMIKWQEARGYPLNFSTEASMNLADDAELMELMLEAGFTQVFIGVESVNPASLRGTLKTQNLRGDSQLEKLTRIREAGLIANAGFIVGFDEDTVDIFEAQYEFIQASRVGLCTVGVLAPLPTTPLYDRLQREGRLYPQDPTCAFIPRNMSRETLKEGRRVLLERIYEPEAFFERVLTGYRETLSFAERRARINRRQHPRYGLKQLLRLGIILSRMTRAAIRLRRTDLLRAYWRAWKQNRELGEKAIPFHSFLDLCTKHWHFHLFSKLPQQSTYLEHQESETRETETDPETRPVVQKQVA